MDSDLHFKQLIWCGGDFDHQRVYLQILNIYFKAHSPFKFNACWLANELVPLLKASWVVYEACSEVSPTSQFAVNLKRLKEVSICWSVKKNAQDIKDLVDIQFAMMENLKTMGFGFNTEEDKFSLVELET